MKTGFRIAPGFVIFLIPLLLSQAASAVPEALFRPRYGDEPLFPRDYVIGELGRGGASEEAYQNARLVLAALVYGNDAGESVRFPDSVRRRVKPVLTALGVRTYRLGGGRNEGDGGVSFLIRFLGRSQSITGELYLRRLETPAAEDDGDEAPAGLSEAAGAPVPAGDGEAADAPVAASSGDEPVTAGAITTGEASSVQKEKPPALMALWELDDILLDSPRPLTEGKYSPGAADMTPYERFF
ncbi:MAG: hypothetical protein LBB82_09750 [Treponema sp.]|jgi:hypothetical protein|nr:hypothetical protein [Treponema sp.]